LADNLTGLVYQAARDGSSFDQAALSRKIYRLGGKQSA
jgi:hypothetical protein